MIACAPRTVSRIKYLTIIYFYLFTVHFRNYTSIHPMIDGGGDVEVLAYVNSNLLVIHNDHSNENNKNLVKSRLIYSQVRKSYDLGERAIT
jgi:hypothetical protein